MVAARRLKIYVVDGDPVVTRTLVDFLGDLEYEAIPLRDAEDLEARLAADAPQTARAVVALLETLGPDPVERLRKIQARQPEVSFVLIAGGSLPPGEAVACRVRAFLPQPLRLSELEVVLADLRGGRPAGT